MSGRPIDPRRLDVAALARDGGRLQGEWPLAALDRLAEDALPIEGDAAPVAWSARGEMRTDAAGRAQIWLHLEARAQVRLTCQRCLGPLAVPLHVTPSLRFVDGEAEAERLDADSEEDVLALEPALDLQTLVEDELILALPLVPRHERCEPPALTAADDPTAREPQAEHPFAALATLRRGPPRGRR